MRAALMTIVRHILLVAGTRPEVIKLAPVYFALAKTPGLNPVFISTGQHREMMDQALAVFGIRPDHDLRIMRPNQTLSDLTSRLLQHLGEYMRQTAACAVLVQGDTTSTLAGALAAFYERIPVGHIEAGLRTYDLSAPWPEEMNRRVVDHFSTWCFAPTDASRDNLLRENIRKEAIFVTGNTVIDALEWVLEKLRRDGILAEQVVSRCGVPAVFAKRFLHADGKFILMTGHRRESFGPGLEAVCQGILRVVSEHPEVGVVFPVHMNPNVRERVTRILNDNPNIALIPPIAYPDFVWFMSRCHIVLSDSGGVQEEAPALGKPVLVTRENTERPEGVSAGTCRIVGTDPARISAEVGLLIRDSAEYARRSEINNPYGDGKASLRIANILMRDLL
mgnify:CR=1 FL=1